MKILMTVTMMLAMTSVFGAECKLNGECTDVSACKALNKDYGIVGGKCVNPASAESQTNCDQIAGAGGAKKVDADGKPADGATGTSTIKK